MKKLNFTAKGIANFIFSILSHMVFISLVFSFLTNCIQLVCFIIFHIHVQSIVLLIGSFLSAVIFSLRHYRPYHLF